MHEAQRIKITIAMGHITNSFSKTKLFHDASAYINRRLHSCIDSAPAGKAGIAPAPHQPTLFYDYLAIPSQQSTPSLLSRFLRTRREENSFGIR